MTQNQQEQGKDRRHEGGDNKHEQLDQETIEKRLENTNEWRSAMSDRDRFLMPRAEAEVLFANLKETVADLTVMVAENRANSKGQISGWSLAVGAAGFIAAVVSLVSLMARAH